MRAQNEIFQSIADMIFEKLMDEWSEIVISYKVEGVRSKETNTYLTAINGQEVEKSLPFVPELNRAMRELRDSVSQNGKQPFTVCRIHFKNNGQFDAEYFYDKIDWDAPSSWNFNVNR